MQDGSIFEGNFENGKLNGKGKIIYGNGDFYEGLVCKNLKHGYGKYISAPPF